MTRDVYSIYLMTRDVYSIYFRISSLLVRHRYFRRWRMCISLIRKDVPQLPGMWYVLVSVLSGNCVILTPLARHLCVTCKPFSVPSFTANSLQTLQSLRLKRAKSVIRSKSFDDKRCKRFCISSETLVARSSFFGTLLVRHRYFRSWRMWNSFGGMWL